MTMILWLLTPTDIRQEPWGFSNVPNNLVISAASESQARTYAAGQEHGREVWLDSSKVKVTKFDAGPSPVVIARSWHG